MDKTKLCKTGQKEMRKWLDDYKKIMHTADRDNALKVFFRPWKHITKCKKCAQAFI